MPGKRSVRIILNISGEIYETHEKTLNRFPKTLLGDSEKRNIYYCQDTQEYYFDRSRHCFGAILYFYQSFGRLLCPPEIPIDDFEIECNFFNLPGNSINRMKLKEGFLCFEEEEVPTLDESSCKRKVWDLLENPETSRVAQLFAIFSLLMILVSIITTCLETLPEFSANLKTNTNDNPWDLIEFSLNLWFLTELILRFAFSPSKLRFIKGEMNWIDAVAIIPYFIVLGVSKDKVTSLGFLRILRFMRVIRLFRLSKHSKRLKVVGEIIKSSVGELHLLMLCLLILVTFGGSLMYYLESYQENSQFTSVPEGLWWGIQTVVTLGYGDVVPQTLQGRLLASCFMAFGALTLCLPVLSIVTKFMSMYAKNV